MKVQLTIAAMMLVSIAVAPLAAADHQFGVEQNSGNGPITDGEVVIYADGIPIATYPFIATHEYSLRQWTTCDGTVITAGDSHVQGILIEGSSAKATAQSSWTGSWIVAGLPFVGSGGPLTGAYPTGVWLETVGYSASGVLAPDAILSLLGGDENERTDPGLIEQVIQYLDQDVEITFSASGSGPHTIYATSERFDVCVH